MLRNSRSQAATDATTEHLIDKNINVTKSAHESVPLQARLRVCWFIMTLAIVGVWSAVYLSPSLSAKTCYVKKAKDGSFSMVNYIDDGLKDDDDI